MSGRPHWREGGQLAALDAMVFFAAALVVSCLILSYDTDSSVGGGGGICIDPDEALSVFLDASVGSEVALQIGDPIVIRPVDQAGECLLVELQALSEGLQASAFDPLNEILCGILADICEPYKWNLSVLVDPAYCILALGCDSVDDAVSVFAGSTNLEDHRGRTYLAVLTVSSLAC